MALEAREEGQRNSKWEEFLVGIPIPHIPHQGGWDGNRVYRVLGTELISRKVILSCVCLNPLFKIILFFILSFHLGSFFISAGLHCSEWWLCLDGSGPVNLLGLESKKLIVNNERKENNA